jgi:hypothetical protein
VPVVRLGDRLGEGIVPPCRDTETFGSGCVGGADETTGGEAVEVFRLPGIHPEVAVAARQPFGPTVYVGPGY